MVLLSIIIPVFNVEKTIGRTLQSLNKLCSESKKHTEVIIVNDGTTDRSLDIVREMQGTLGALDVLICNQTNQGLASARNTGLRRSTGEWIFLLDADDELAFDPIPFVREHAEASALTFSVEYHRNSRRRKTRHPSAITPGNHLDVFTTGNVLTVSSILFKRQRVSSFFNTDFLSLEDWHFWMMNPLIFEDVRSLPAVTSAIIHLHESNMSLNAVKMGTYRQRVAESIAADSSIKRLTRKQRNNLVIQARIGRIQQGARIPLGTFLLVPCSASLYARLAAYFVLRDRIASFGFYAA